MNALLMISLISKRYITEILPGYICCIKRGGLTLNYIVQTGQYQFVKILGFGN